MGTDIYGGRGGIPDDMWADFCAVMATQVDNDLPDGAWWQVLENTAEFFIAKRGLKADANTATHQFLWEWPND